MINASTSSSTSSISSISAEDLMEMKNTYSDLHKDVYGFRPRHNWTSPDFNLVVEYNYLQNKLSLQLEEEAIADAFGKAKEMELSYRYGVDVETLIKWGVLDSYTNWRYSSEWFNFKQDEAPLTRPKLKSKAEVKKSKAKAKYEAAKREAARWATRRACYPFMW